MVWVVPKLGKADCTVTKGQRWCDGNKSIDNAVVPMAMVILVKGSDGF